MGRPREHDDTTARALLGAAERIVQRSGVEALSVRGVADEVGTSTRAVYSLFGSKNGLVVALGAHAFRLLGTAINELATTDDPASDLVGAGVAVFRSFALQHPFLFKIAVQHTAIPPDVAKEFRAAADEAMQGLEARVARLHGAGLLGPRTLREGATHFHALCEGLAALELRGALTKGHEERIWRDALTALVAGFAAADTRGRTNDDRNKQARQVAKPPRRSSA